MARNIEADGQGRRRLLPILQQYCVVVKAIAITPEFDLSRAMPTRKAELDEVIEVHEEPRCDDKQKMTHSVCSQQDEPQPSGVAPPDSRARGRRGDEGYESSTARQCCGRRHGRRKGAGPTRRRRRGVAILAVAKG